MQKKLNFDLFVVLSTSFFSLGASIAYSIITYIRKRKSLAGSRLRVQTVRITQS